MSNQEMTPKSTQFLGVFWKLICKRSKKSRFVIFVIFVMIGKIQITKVSTIPPIGNPKAAPKADFAHQTPKYHFNMLKSTRTNPKIGAS